jgi:hypothetical protein
MDVSSEIEAWDAVPGRVVADYRRLVKAANVVRALYAATPRRAYWNPDTGRSALDAPPEPGYILVKAAEYDFLRTPTDAAVAIQKPLGGPSALTSALLGGAIGSGLGYTGGAAIEQLLPEDQVERGRLRRTLALAGGITGAVPAGLLGHAFKQAAIAAGVDDMAIKAASAAGTFYQPSIPVDAFNRVVWSDVASGPSSAYGTKSSWGDNTQQLSTPPWAAAAASGLVAGTGAATGMPAISPFQLATTAATSAGVGYLAASAFGKTMGALAGLRPEAQAQLQNLGLWGGLVTGAVRGLFGGGK